MTSRTTRIVVSIGWLTALWVLLWRDAALPNIAVGLVLATAVTMTVGAQAAPDARRRRRHRLRPVAAIRFLAYFTWKLVESNVVIAREVVTPQNRIQTGIIGVAMPDCSDLVVTIVANAVSLTPGTLTLDVRPGEPTMLFVHVLHLHDVDDARDDVRTLTRMVRAAIEPRDAADVPVTTDPGASA